MRTYAVDYRTKKAVVTKRERENYENKIIIKPYFRYFFRRFS